MRVNFEKGKQKQFINEIMKIVNAPSLGELARRVEINYSTFKNYFGGARLLPKELFDTLCDLAGLNLEVSFVKNNWGQVKGGKRSKRK